MSEEGPKLYSHKPKKSKLKVSAPSTMESSSGAPAAPPHPPPPPPPPPLHPQPQKESFVRRYRFLWPLLLVVNFSIGAYVLMRTRQKDTGSSGADTPDGSTILTSTSTATTATLSEVPSAPIIKEPVAIQRAPIPEDQQREIFRWMLEEKRKVKPKDAEEKKRIDEEKAILKQFIRSKSLPAL